MINEILDDAKIRMEKSVESLKSELMRLRTGRANTGLLDSIKVDYYGSPTPLSQVANINVQDARTLSVQPQEHPARCYFTHQGITKRQGYF